MSGCWKSGEEGLQGWSEGYERVTVEIITKIGERHVPRRDRWQSRQLTTAYTGNIGFCSFLLLLTRDLFLFHFDHFLSLLQLHCQFFFLLILSLTCVDLGWMMWFRLKESTICVISFHDHFGSRKFYFQSAGSLTDRVWFLYHEEDEFLSFLD